MRKVTAILFISLFFGCQNEAHRISELKTELEQAKATIDSLTEIQSQLAFTPFALDWSPEIYLGEEYRAEIFLGYHNPKLPITAVEYAFDGSSSKATKDTLPLTASYGRPIYRFTPTKRGKHYWAAKVISDILGNEKEYFIEVEYNVK
jgi:hypothetical protein